MSKKDETVTVLGKKYIRLYDNKGKTKDEFNMFGIDIEESIEELQQAGLVEVVKVKGVKYYRTLPPY